jgi:hypothetical protein
LGYPLANREIDLVRQLFSDRTNRGSQSRTFGGLLGKWIFKNWYQIDLDFTFAE